MPEGKNSIYSGTGLKHPAQSRLKSNHAEQHCHRQYISLLLLFILFILCTIIIIGYYLAIYYTGPVLDLTTLLDPPKTSTPPKTKRNAIIELFCGNIYPDTPNGMLPKYDGFISHIHLLQS